MTDEENEELSQYVNDETCLGKTKEPLFLVRDGLVQPIIGLRDYFAGQALAGLLSNADYIPMKKSNVDSFAQNAYMVADAMLAHREKSV